MTNALFSIASRKRAFASGERHERARGRRASFQEDPAVEQPVSSRGTRIVVPAIIPS